MTTQQTSTSHDKTSGIQTNSSKYAGALNHTSLCILASVVLMLVSCSKPARSMSPSEGAVIATLQPACMGLTLAAVDGRSGKGCNSLAEAVKHVTSTRGGGDNIWRFSQATNAQVFLNPDWGKWCVAATNENFGDDDLAAYCTLTMADSNGTAFWGMTFNLKLVVITNALPWPSAMDLLRE